MRSCLEREGVPPILKKSYEGERRRLCFCLGSDVVL